MTTTIALAALMSAQTPVPIAPSSDLTTVTGCGRLYTQQDQRQYVRAVMVRKEISRKAHRRMRVLRTCQHTKRASKNALRYERQQRKRRYERKRREEALTPYGDWAIPAAIVMCESRGSFTAQNPSGAYGAYQLMPTWWGHLGRKPTPSEQHAIARKLWNGGRGASHWVCKA